MLKFLVDGRMKQYMYIPGYASPLISGAYKGLKSNAGFTANKFFLRMA
jgi:hypothetical protein